MTDPTYNATAILNMALVDLRNQDRPPPHPIIRAMERYGLALTTEDLRDATRDIENSVGVKGPYLGQGRRIYYIKIKNVTCRIVYNQSHKHIVTFLPPTGPLVCKKKFCPTKSMRRRYAS